MVIERRIEKKKLAIILVSLLLLTAAIIAVLVVFLAGRHICEEKFVSPSKLGWYGKAAVSANGPECSQVGADTLAKDGTAVDAAIATLLCEGIASAQSMGLGGGFLMTIWDAKTQTADYLDARETAPAAATKDMFHGNGTLSAYGGLAVAIPGELLGYYEAHKKYGKLPWADLFKPAIELAKKGAIVTQYLADRLASKESQIKAEKTMAEILINPATNSTWRVGDRIKRPKLAVTLEKLANQGPSLFYNGSMADDLVREIRAFKGIITKEDFRNYRVKWKKPIKVETKDATIYSAPPPGSGPLLAFMMNVLQGMVPMVDKAVMWQRIIETFKWAYARRTEMGDPDFVNIENLITNLTSREYADVIRKRIKDDWTSNNAEDYGAVTVPPTDSGTAHVSILAPDGSAVSVTSTINLIYGAMIRSESTGIIFNDEMDDFSSPDIVNDFGIPPSPANFIEPGKRPLSSMSPTIVLGKDNHVRLVIGAAGGTKITTAIASGIILNLWSGYNIKEAIDAYRLHHQLFPMMVQNEKGYCQGILDYLNKIGHKTEVFSGIGSAMTAVANYTGLITANSDYRREGMVAGF